MKSIDKERLYNSVGVATLGGGATFIADKGIYAAAKRSMDKQDKADRAFVEKLVKGKNADELLGWSSGHKHKDIYKELREKSKIPKNTDLTFDVGPMNSNYAERKRSNNKMKVSIQEGYKSQRASHVIAHELGHIEQYTSPKLKDKLINKLTAFRNMTKHQVPLVAGSAAIGSYFGTHAEKGEEAKAGLVSGAATTGVMSLGTLSEFDADRRAVRMLKQTNLLDSKGSTLKTLINYGKQRLPAAMTYMASPIAIGTGIGVATYALAKSLNLKKDEKENKKEFPKLVSLPSSEQRYENLRLN